MKANTRLLLLAAVAAWVSAVGSAETPAQGAPAPGVFEQTVPPQWTAESPVSAEPFPGPVDPQMVKIQQVRAELAKAEEAPAPAAIPAEPPREFSAFRSSVRAFSMLCVVLAIIAVLAYLIKRFGKRSALFAGSHLARVLGKVYLEPRVCLHFVQTGGKVLVVGVTPNAITAIAAFEAAAFEGQSGSGAALENVEADVDGFLAELRASIEGKRKTDGTGRVDDSDVAALRKEIQRLQQYLEDMAREPKQ
jgi:flagellar biogenesis protein FliO